MNISKRSSHQRSVSPLVSTYDVDTENGNKKDQSEQEMTEEKEGESKDDERDSDERVLGKYGRIRRSRI